MGKRIKNELDNYSRMKVSLGNCLMSILPLASIFLLGNYFPPSQQEYRPVFQPPGWVFGVVWSYVALAFGIVSVMALDKVNVLGKSGWVVVLFYVVLLCMLNGWLVVNSKKEYKIGFYWLLATAWVSIAYIAYLGGLGLKGSVWLLPLPFWLVLATALNGVIYDVSVRR